MPLANRRCWLWGWRKGVPGGGAFHCCEGRLWSVAPPPPTARPLGGLLGSATPMLWAQGCGCGDPTLSPWPACPVGAACRGGGGGPSPGGVACHRCEGRLVSGAVPLRAARPLGRAAGVPRPVCPGCGQCERGDPAPAPQRAPLRRCSLWGWRKGVPGGAAFHRCEGRLRSGAPPPPTARPLGGRLRSATHVLWARVCGCGGPTLSPWPECPVGAACCGGGGGPSPGGVACHRCEGRLVSGAVPPPAARPLGRAARVQRPGFPGCGRCGRGDPAPAPRRAPLQAGVARRRGGGRASPGGVPSADVRGVWGQAFPLPRLPALLAGCRRSLAKCCGRGCGCVRCVWFLCVACRGAWCRFSLLPLVLRSPVLRCGVVPAVCRVAAVPPSLCASLARLLATPCFVRGFVALFPFLCSPFSVACTFSLPPPCCVCLSFSSPAFSLVAPCETKGRVGVSGPSSCNVGTTFVAASRRITYLPSHSCLRV